MEDRLKKSAYDIVNVYRKVLKKRLNIDIPEIELNFDLCNTRPKVAACAIRNVWQIEESTVKVFKININMVIFRENVQETLNNTIPHEIAHIVQYIIAPSDPGGHSYKWIEIMNTMGIKPVVYHTFDLTNAIKHYKAYNKAIKKQKAEEKKKRQEQNSIGGMALSL